MIHGCRKPTEWFHERAQHGDLKFSRCHNGTGFLHICFDSFKARWHVEVTQAEGIELRPWNKKVARDEDEFAT